MALATTPTSLPPVILTGLPLPLAPQCTLREADVTTTQDLNDLCLERFHETFDSEQYPALNNIISTLYYTPEAGWDKDFNALFQDALYRSDTFTSRFFEERTAFGKVVQNFWNSSYTVDCDTIAEAEVEAKALAEKLSSLQCRAKKVAKPEAGVLDKISGFFSNFLSPLPAEGTAIKDKNQIIPDQEVKVGELFNYTIPAHVFEGNPALSAQRKSGRKLPNWLTFLPLNGTFQGTSAEKKSHQIELIGTYPDGATNSTYFDLEVTKDSSPNYWWIAPIAFVGVTAAALLYAHHSDDKRKVDPDY